MDNPINHDPSPPAENQKPVDIATASIATGDIVLPHSGAGEQAIPTAIVSREEFENCIPARAFKLDSAAIRVIRELKCPGANDLEVMHFLYMCHALGLNPLLPGQISFTAYAKDDEDGERRRVVMIEIGGYRNLAARTGRYRQGDPPVLEWAEKSDHPAACTVSLYERVDREWVRRERRFMWEEFRMFHGRAMWKKNPAAMFPKTCEVALIRFYFFDGVAGIYTTEEIEAPDIQDAIDATKPRTEAKTTSRMIHERTVEMLKEAASVYAKAGMDPKQSKSAAGRLARATNPDHAEFDTWGETEIQRFRTAVNALDTEPKAAS